MKRIGSVFLNVALTMMVLFIVFAVVAKAGPSTCPPSTPCPSSSTLETCCNGDINGDQSINIADAVSLLGYLFDGGEPPAAFAQALAPEVVISRQNVRSFAQQGSTGVPGFTVGSVAGDFVITDIVAYSLGGGGPTQATLITGSGDVLLFFLIPDSTSSEPKSLHFEGGIRVPAGETIDVLGNGAVIAQVTITGYELLP